MKIVTLLLNLFFLMIPQSFEIKGTIRDPSGRGVANIRVSLLDENYQSIRTVFADGSGRFQFRGIAPSRVYVRVETFDTDFEERTESLDLQPSLSTRGVVEPILVEIVLKLKKGMIRPESGTLFSQEVPEPARTELEKGVESLSKGKQDAAIESFKKGIEIFPDYFKALEALGVEYVKQGQFDAAMPVLTHAVEINDKGERSLYALGVAHLKLSHNREAIRWLEKAREREPLSVNTHMMLGLAHGNLNQLEESETFLKKAYELGGKGAADAHLYLAGIFNKKMRYPEAIKELEAYLKEAKGGKDPDRIKKMIEDLKAKK